MRRSCLDASSSWSRCKSEAVRTVFHSTEFSLASFLCTAAWSASKLSLLTGINVVAVMASESSSLRSTSGGSAGERDRSVMVKGTNPV